MPKIFIRERSEHLKFFCEQPHNTDETPLARISDHGGEVSGMLYINSAATRMIA
jgi:hypothetical protein